MLDTLRTAAGTWVAKLLLFMLVISFAIWGISGRMIGGFGSSHVITAGGTTVSLKEYRLAYERQIQMMSQQLGIRLTREQAAGVRHRQPGAGATGQRRGARRAGAQARARRLQGSDRAARARRAGLQGTRRQVRPAAVRAGAAASRHDARGLSGQHQAGRRPPADRRGDFRRAAVRPTRSSRRSRSTAARTAPSTISSLPRSLVEPIEEPGESVLKTWFDERKATYAAPEYRKIAYIKLDPEALADPSAISDEQVQEGL